MIKYIYLIGIVSFLGCNNNQDNIIDIDVSKDSTVVISTTANTPSTLKLRVMGEIDDSFQVQHIILPGRKIDTTLIMDCYNPNFSIKYKAYKATKGSLKIEYHLF